MLVGQVLLVPHCSPSFVFFFALIWRQIFPSCPARRYRKANKENLFTGVLWFKTGLQCGPQASVRAGGATSRWACSLLPWAPEALWFFVAVTLKPLWGPLSMAAAQPRRTKQPLSYSESFYPSLLGPLLSGRVLFLILFSFSFQTCIKSVSVWWEEEGTFWINCSLGELPWPWSVCLCTCVRACVFLFGDQQRIGSNWNVLLWFPCGPGLAAVYHILASFTHTNFRCCWSRGHGLEPTEDDQVLLSSGDRPDTHPFFLAFGFCSNVRINRYICLGDEHFVSVPISFHIAPST